ncbi:hypothetical protein CCM_02753 [Cordyceps militaris CM01]|uniref:Uncharacterized protein n=1 Tax=Cordyceps militaris (strain CM01) TaxID=983644 RepID=G3JBH5_CORMM|nr:uncharacterized protein CCM_02753 [Cordyceps militaris CM01]EGX94482.1 hypothetical protein CCM_02753 [Cordyceps militaris CM01]
MPWALGVAPRSCSSDDISIASPVESHYGRGFLYGMPKFDRTPIEHDHSYTGSSSASQTTQSSTLPGIMYGSARLPAMGSSPSYNGSVWPTESHQLDYGGVSSAPMSAVWPQSNFSPYIPDTSVSLPSTPAPIGLYQPPCQDHTAQMPHLNTPPASAISRVKMSSDESTDQPQLKVSTGLHGYFKENGSVIMNKWFSNTATQVAPPQLYNVPPPASLSPQDSFNDASSVASGKNFRATPSRSHPARSDFSSRVSFTNAADYSSQSPQASYPARRRLPNNTSPSPTVMKGQSTSGVSSHNSPRGGASAAPSIYESESNYAASSAQSSSQPSRLPSPMISDHNKNAQNSFLIEARASGMSYKEIKAKGGFSEAESTLRGRHRMLTKEKESRVRKPEWTETDVSSTKPK